MLFIDLLLYRRTSDDQPFFLLTTRVLAAARLSRRDTTWKNAEFLLLHHRARRRPATTRRAHPAEIVLGTDRALIALLFGLIPNGRHPRLRLIVTPGTILCWRRDILRRRLAAKSRSKGSPPSPAPPGSGCPQLHRPAATGQRRRSFTSARTNSASRRKQNSRQSHLAVSADILLSP